MTNLGNTGCSVGRNAFPDSGYDHPEQKAGNENLEFLMHSCNCHVRTHPSKKNTESVHPAQPHQFSLCGQGEVHHFPRRWRVDGGRGVIESPPCSSSAGFCEGGVHPPNAASSDISPPKKFCQIQFAATWSQTWLESHFPAAVGI